MKKLFTAVPRWALIVLLLASVVTNGWLGMLIYRQMQLAQHQPAVSTTDLAASYPFLSKRIFVDNPNDILINFVGLRTQLSDYIQSRSEQTGVYFEYLPSGVSIGIHEKDNYLLASLLKIPVAMGVLDQVAKGKLDLGRYVTLTQDDLDPNFGQLYQQGAGYSLTLSETLRWALTQSDNTANKVLLRLISPAQVSDVFDSLDIPKDVTDQKPVVTPKNYSSILRSLYLSSYLPTQYSNQLLELLTQSAFNDKLVAGVPNDIKVAHKIGEYDIATDPNHSIFTDCGIVYAAKRPYILCMMTKSTEASAQTAMKSISAMVYQYVVSQ